MAIYRGSGGSGTASDTAAVEQVSSLTSEAENYKDAAAASATAAASSATAAATSATASATSAIAASGSATTAASEASDAATSATAAASSATAAATSATSAAASATTAETAVADVDTAVTAAQTAQAAAETAETNAASSASSASTSATSASTSATNAATSATNAATSETNAATSATNAAASETAAATSETNAATSATAAASSATSAASSATSASTAQTAAETAQTAAETAQTAAETAQTAAETAETNAATSATSASTSATNAATSATSASTSATNAATSATNAATSATNASTSETNAASSATSAASAQSAAEAARDSALAAYDSFDDRYLGVKASDPSLDNDGNALVAGTLYFNSTDEKMKLYTGSSWVDAYTTGAGFLQISSNLSDLNNAATARTNLGLGTAATTASTDYATAAQGTLADSALQSSDIGVTVQGYSSVLANTTASFTTADETKLDGIETNATADQTASEIKTAYESNADTNAFTDAEQTKLSGIETNADVTDTANVTAAGALMDSEVTNLSQVKAFDSSDYATAAQGTLADSALQSSDIGTSVQAYSSVLAGTTASYTTAEKTKLDGIESGATADQTASEILTAIKTVDGSGSGLDADTVDGLQASQFVRSDTSDTMSGTLSVTTVNIGDEINLTGAAGSSAKIQKNASTGRDELQIYAGGDAYSTGSAGAGIHLYGNSDNEHDGNCAILTGPSGQGDGRLIVSGWDTDTHVTIGNTIWDWVDAHNDTGLLNLKNPVGCPALYITDTSASEGEIAVPTGEAFDIGHWSGSAFTSRLQIDSDGDVLIGRTSSFSSGSHAFQSGSGTATLDIYCPTTTTGRNIVNIRSNVGGTADVCAAIEANGDFLSDSNSYGSNSDSRLKQDIVDANSQLDDIKALDFKNFRLKKQVEVSGDAAPTMLGVIAQDLETAGMSGLVAEGETTYWTQDDADSDDGLPDGVSVGDVKEQGYKAVKYSVLYMKAVKALQETIEIVEAQQATINDLTSRIEALEAE